MSQATQADLVCRLRDHLRARTTDMEDDVVRVPASYYTDPEHAARERAWLFLTRPHIAALSKEVSRPGDYVTVSMLGIPMLIVRQADGTVAVLVNACRHRGAKVAQSACGTVESFKCPFHAWRYGLDGRLLSIPRGGLGFEGVGAERESLIRFPAAERHGFIWVVPTAGATPLDIAGYIGEDFDAELQVHDFDRWELDRVEVFDEPMNWKVAYEGILDTLHVPFVHPTTVSRYMDARAYVATHFPNGTRNAMGKRSISRTATMTEIEDPMRYLFVGYYLFPSTVIVYQSRHLEVWTVLPHQDDPARCEVTIRMVTAPRFESAEDRDNYAKMQWGTFMDVAYNEDWDVSRKVQAGLAGNALPYLVFGRNEGPIQHFHRYIGDALNMEEYAL